MSNPERRGQNARMNSRRHLAIALVLAAACSTTGSPTDAGNGVISGSFDQPVGAACDATQSLLCASGFGACHDRVCRPFCSSVDVPRCPDGSTELHATTDGRDLCLCIAS